MYSINIIEKQSNMYALKSNLIILLLFGASKEVSSNQNWSLVTKLAGNVSNGEMETSGCLLGNAQLSQTPNLFHNIRSSEVEMPIKNVRQRGDVYGKIQLLARYLPRITGEELQKVARSYPFTISLLAFDLINDMMRVSDILVNLAVIRSHCL